MRPGPRLFLGMADAVAGRHQVDLAGPDDLFRSQAVAVQDLAFQHPGERLQAEVRMRPHVQRLAGLRVRRPQVIQKAPGAHHAALAGGQGAEVLVFDLAR